MKIEHGLITFSSGKQKTVDRSHIIGIAPNLKIVTHGSKEILYDHTVTAFGEEGSLTSTEQIELSHYMIGLWQEFAHRAAMNRKPEDIRIPFSAFEKAGEMIAISENDLIVAEARRIWSGYDNYVMQKPGEKIAKEMEKDFREWGFEVKVVFEPHNYFKAYLYYLCQWVQL